MLGLRIDVVELAAHDQRCHERLIGSPAGMSLNPAKFQFPLAQNRGALQCVTDSTKIWRKIRVSGHVQQQWIRGAGSHAFNPPERKLQIENPVSGALS